MLDFSQSWPPVSFVFIWTGPSCTDRLFLHPLCPVYPIHLVPSLQHTFLTQQCLNQELTLDLLEKYRNPEKLKTCLVTEDDEMEVSHDLTCSIKLSRNFVCYLSIHYRVLFTQIYYFNTILFLFCKIAFCGFNLTVDFKLSLKDFSQLMVRMSVLCPLPLFPLIIDSE